MKYSEAKQGRIFIIRLEDGDIVHTCIEQFAKEHGIQSAALIVLGGADTGSQLITGPKEDRAKPIIPCATTLTGVHEVTGTGTLFPDHTGQPVLHMHMATGRTDSCVTGCIRAGVKTWHVMEVVLFELTHCSGRRLPDPITGFELLVP